MKVRWQVVAGVKGNGAVGQTLDRGHSGILSAIIALSQASRGSQLVAETRHKPLIQYVQSGPVAAGLEKQIKAALPFPDCYKKFGESVTAVGLELPAGQLTHVLRHTFARHYMMNGGDILTLQRVLGHASLDMTMKYAHHSPGHLAEVVNLNPLAVGCGHSVDAGSEMKGDLAKA